MTKRLLFGLGALLLAAGPALAQGEGEPEEAGPGRVRFDREQGDPDELKARVEELLAAIAAEDAEQVGELLGAMAPDEDVVEDVFTPEGQETLGPRLLEGVGRLFEGEPMEVAGRLPLSPKRTEVEVFTASKEDLSSMEYGTVAARHFASGLRAMADMLKAQYHFYSVRMTDPADEEGRGEYLQLFVYSGGRYVLLGRIWRLV